MSAPFVPHTEDEIAAMLDFLGLTSLDELFESVPAAIRLAGGLDLACHASEPDVADRLADLAAANRPIGRSLVCFAGAGAYDHEVPAVVRSLASRSEFVTAYTPYQPEVAQGVLQAIFEYQSMISRLSGMEITNGSLYDGAASLVEAVNLAVAATSDHRVLCSDGVNPRWREGLSTFAAGPRHEITRIPLRDGRTDWASAPDGSAGAVVVALTNYLGALDDVAGARQLADSTGARLVVCYDPVASGILRTPGSLGADIAVGEGQALGMALSFGGPYLGLFSCRMSDVRRLPGRLVGETVDNENRRAYVTTLRAREQDIRRERASSNVCTNQTLMAVTAAIQLGWLGTDGLIAAALGSARATRYTRELLTGIDGVSLIGSAPTLLEFALRLPVEPELVVERMVEEGFLAGVPVREGYEGTEAEGSLLVAATERRTRSEIDAFAAAFEKAVR